MEFLESVQRADENELQKLLLMKMSHLDERIVNPPENIIDQILQIASIKIQVFNNTEIYNMITNWMRTSRNSSIFRKNKMTADNRNSLSRVAAAIAIELLKSKPSWPLDLLNIYLDDALGCRQWVDAPELNYLTQNLLEWTKHCSEAPLLSTHILDEHDDSSEEEEVLDGSSSSLITGRPALPEVYDRFQGRHDEALNIVFGVLANRSGLEVGKISLSNAKEYTELIRSSTPLTGALMNASSFLVNTMQSFCFLAPIRFLAAKCMSIWITNPALVEHVGRLLSQIGQGLLETKSELLLESDLQTIEALIKLRPSLKLSLAEVHRNILISVAPRSPTFAVLITRLHLMENTLNRGNKPDSIKLLLHILQSLSDTDQLLAHVPNHHCPGESKTQQHDGTCPTTARASASPASVSVGVSGHGGFEYVSMILGMSIRQIIVSDIYLTVDPSDFKTILEDCLKIIRQIGIGIFCPVTMCSHLFSTMEPQDDDINNSIISPDAVRFLSDLSLAIQLLFTNSIVLSDRMEREEKRQVALVTTGSDNQQTTGRGGGNSGRGPGSGRGSGRAPGRGAGISTEGSSMFRSSNKVSGNPNSGRGRGGSSGRGSINLKSHSEKDDIGSVVDLNVTTVGGVGGGKDLDLERENLLKSLKDSFNLRSASVREISLRWFVHYLEQLVDLFQEDLSSTHPVRRRMDQRNRRAMSSSPRSPSPPSQLSPNIHKTEEMLLDDSSGALGHGQGSSRKRSNSTVSVDSIASESHPPSAISSTSRGKETTSRTKSSRQMSSSAVLSTISLPYLIDRLQQFLCCLNLQLSTKITSLDLDKMTTILARDHHLFTSDCLSLLFSSLSLLSELDHLVFIKQFLLQQQKTGGDSETILIYSTEMSQNTKTSLSFVGNLSSNLNAIQTLFQSNTSNSSSGSGNGSSSSRSGHMNPQPTYNGVPLLSSAVDLIDHCIQKGLRTSYQDTLGFLVKDDISLIGKLFQLSHVNIFDSSSPSPPSPPCPSPPPSPSLSPALSPDRLDPLDILTSIETDRILIQNGFSYKEIYWKICVVCYLIGCASPKVIGSFLWDHIPSVQSLLLMSISERFYYPPSISMTAVEKSMVTNTGGAATAAVSSTLFNGFELFPRSTLEDDLKSETGDDGNGKMMFINLKEVQQRAHEMKAKIMSFTSTSHSSLSAVLYDCDRFIHQEEAYLWERICQQRIKRSLPLPQEAAPVPPLDQDFIELSDVEDPLSPPASPRGTGAVENDAEDGDDSSSIDENESIEKLMKKRMRPKGKKETQTPAKKKKREVPLELTPQEASEEVVNQTESVVTRKSSRKHVSKFNIQELFKTENDDEEEQGEGEREETRFSSDSEHEFDEEEEVQEEEEYEDGGESGEEEYLCESEVRKRKKKSSTKPKTKESKQKKSKHHSRSRQRFPRPPAVPEDSQYVTANGIPAAHEVLFLPLQLLSRVPPEEVIRTVKSFHLKFKFGKVLRLCEDPDFIASVASASGRARIAGESSAAGAGAAAGGGGVDERYPQMSTREDLLESIGWMVPAINAEISSNILNRIPSPACAHLLSILLHQNCSQFADYLSSDERALQGIIFASLQMNSTAEITSSSSASPLSASASEHFISLHSKEQQQLLTSKSYRQDFSLCSQIIQKLFQLIHSTISPSHSSPSPSSALGILIAKILLTMTQEDSEDKESGDKDEGSLTSFRRKIEEDPYHTSHTQLYRCGEVLGILFKELVQADWLRRSIGRIILTSLFSLFSPTTPLSSSSEFTNFFTLLLTPPAAATAAPAPAPGTGTGTGPSDQFHTLLFQNLFTQIFVIETHRSTLCSLLTFLKTYRPQNYQLLSSQLLLLNSPARLEFLSSLILLQDLAPETTAPVGQSDPLHALIQDILESISHRSLFGNIVLPLSLSPSDSYTSILTHSVSVRNEFLLLCGILLFQIFTKNKFTGPDTATPAPADTSFSVSLCQELFGSFLSQCTPISIITLLPQTLLTKLLNSSTLSSCEFLLQHMTLPTRLSFYQRHYPEMSIQLLTAGLDSFETVLIASQQQGEGDEEKLTMTAEVKEMFHEIFFLILESDENTDTTNAAQIMRWEHLIRVTDYIPCPESKLCGECDRSAETEESQAMDLETNGETRQGSLLSEFESLQLLQSFPSPEKSFQQMLERYDTLYGQQQQQQREEEEEEGVTKANWRGYAKIPEFGASLLLPFLQFHLRESFFPSLNHFIDWILWLGGQDLTWDRDQMAITLIDFSLSLLSQLQLSPAVAPQLSASPSAAITVSSDFFDLLVNHLAQLFLLTSTLSDLIPLLWNRLYQATSPRPQSPVSQLSVSFLQNLLLTKSQHLRSFSSSSSSSLFEANDLSLILSPPFFAQFLHFLLIVPSPGSHCLRSQQLIDCVATLASTGHTSLYTLPLSLTSFVEILFAQKIIQTGIPIIFSFPDSSSSLPLSSPHPAPINYFLLRTLLFHAYLSFPDDVLDWIAQWINSHPPLPSRWITLLQKNDSQNKQLTRLKKRSDLLFVEETFKLSDGRLWSEAIAKDIQLLFQLLMIEEGRGFYFFGPLLEQLTQGQGQGQAIAVTQEQEEDKREFLLKHSSQKKKYLKCVFDQQLSVTLQLLLLDDKGAGVASEVLLSARCQEFLLKLSQRHPSLFLRYQPIIRFYLTKPRIKSSNNKQHQSSHSATETSTHSQSKSQPQLLLQTPPPLSVIVNFKDPHQPKQLMAMTKNLLFTATGAEVQVSLWESLLSAYERCDPVVLYLHTATRPYAMDRVLELIQDLADRRAAFTGWMNLSPPPLSELDSKLKSCLKVISNDGIVKIIRKEKRLLRLLSVLEDNLIALELVKLDIYLPLQSFEEELG